MLVILLLLIFIRPFISSLAFPEVNLIYSILLIGFLGIWLILKGLPLKEIKPIKYPLMLLCLAFIICVSFSQDKFKSLIELYKYILGLLLFLTGISLTSKHKAGVVQTIILAGFIISLLAIYQYFLGFRHLLNYIAKEKITDPFVLDYLSHKRAFFPFVTANTLAGYFAFIVPLVLVIKEKGRWLILLAVSFSLLLTKSLGALLSLFLALAAYFYLENISRKSPQADNFKRFSLVVSGKCFILSCTIKRKRILLLVGLLAIIVLVFIIRSLSQQYTQPLFSTLRRINYWKGTLEIIRVSPLTGVGLGNFSLMQSLYAHNSYLQIWAEMGILGIISILWLITAVFKSALKNIIENTQKNQIISLIAANTVFLAHNLVDFTFFLPEVALLWWLILGLVIPKDNNENSYRNPNL